MNNLRGIYTIWYRDLVRFWNDKTRMIGSLVMPFLFLFVFGQGLSSSLGITAAGGDFTRFMFPGVIGMSVLSSSFMGGVSVVWDREFGFLKEVLVAPISRGSVALGKTLGAATTAMIQGGIILAFASLVDVSLSLKTVALLVPLMFLLAVSMGSFGVFLATRIRTMEAFFAVTQMLMYPLVFLSGVFFPVEGVPTWMGVMMRINPATYGVTAIRQVILGTSGDVSFGVTLFGHSMSLAASAGVLAGFGALMILMGMWSFSHQEQFSMSW